MKDWKTVAIAGLAFALGGSLALQRPGPAHAQEDEVPARSHQEDLPQAAPLATWEQHTLCRYVYFDNEPGLELEPGWDLVAVHMVGRVSTKNAGTNYQNIATRSVDHAATICLRRGVDPQQEAAPDAPAE